MNPQSSSHPNSVAYCQNCGKPLSPDERRDVGQAVFCEPCLVERVAAAPPYRAAGGVYPGPASAPRYVSGTPNPGLAALLGFIPGVGAMYNGQYAKGLIHLIVFAILISLSDQHGIFGLFIAGWILYQVIEAHHTARARRDGTPLPNPFGLNDLGERLGFGKAWPAAAPGPSTPPVPPAPANPVENQAGRPAYDWERYAWEQANAPHPPQQPTAFAGATTPPFTGPYKSPYVGAPRPNPGEQNRFPTGALWLIGLGIVFLVGNVGIFHSFPVRLLLPFLIFGVGIWLFVHKMMSSGRGVADDGSPQYRGRLFNALRGSVWIMLTGILFFLDNADILSWGRSWPLWIILAGLMAFLQRSVVPLGAYPATSTYGATSSSSYGATPAPPTQTPAQPEVTQASNSLSIIPRDEEGRQL